jgi:hypothetical protein
MERIGCVKIRMEIEPKPKRVATATPQRYHQNRARPFLGRTSVVWSLFSHREIPLYKKWSCVSHVSHFCSIGKCAYDIFTVLLLLNALPRL